MSRGEKQRALAGISELWQPCRRARLRSLPVGSKPPSGKTACSFHIGRAFSHSQMSTYIAPEATAALLLPCLHIIQNFPNQKILTSDQSLPASPLVSGFSLPHATETRLFLSFPYPSQVHITCRAPHPTAAPVALTRTGVWSPAQPRAAAQPHPGHIPSIPFSSLENGGTTTYPSRII